MTAASETRVKNDSNVSVTLLDVRAVERAVGVRRTKIYALVASEEFPAPYKIGARSLWRSDEISHWIDKVTGRVTVTCLPLSAH